MGVGVSNDHRGARLQRPQKRVSIPGALDKGPLPLTTAPPGMPHFSYCPPFPHSWHCSLSIEAAAKTSAVGQ